MLVHYYHNPQQGAPLEHLTVRVRVENFLLYALGIQETCQIADEGARSALVEARQCGTGLIAVANHGEPIREIFLRGNMKLQGLLDALERNITLYVG